MPTYELSNGRKKSENPEKKGPFDENGGMTSPSMVIVLSFFFPCRMRMASFGCHVLAKVMMPSAAWRVMETCVCGLGAPFFRNSNGNFCAPSYFNLLGKRVRLSWCHFDGNRLMI